MILGLTVHRQLLACQQRSLGWQSNILTRNGAKIYCFISIINWRDHQHGSALAVRKEWCRDLANGLHSYDRLGHQIDALQMLAVFGVESRSIVLNP
jgi:hypothetical protein